MFKNLIEKIGFNDAISALQGTFGCWYYDADHGCLRIFRSGSTVFFLDLDIDSEEPTSTFFCHFLLQNILQNSFLFHLGIATDRLHFCKFRGKPYLA